MTTKYGFAKDLIEACNAQSDAAGIEPGDAQQALLISLIQTLKALSGPIALKSVLQMKWTASAVEAFTKFNAAKNALWQQFRELHPRRALTTVEAISNSFSSV